MTHALKVLLAAACALACCGAAPRRPAYGPFPTGRLEVHLRSSVPLGFCEVTLSRDGTIVRRGKPEGDGQSLAFEGLAPGHYDLSVVCRSYVPQGPTSRRSTGRIAVWMRNGRADADVELRVKRKEKPETAELELKWSRPVAQYLIRD